LTTDNNHIGSNSQHRLSGQVSTNTTRIPTSCSDNWRRSSIAPPRSNGHSRTAFVERLHRTLLDEHFRVEGRKTWFETVKEMQLVLDAYLEHYNQR